jgi:hypothetical protein
MNKLDKCSELKAFPNEIEKGYSNSYRDTNKTLINDNLSYAYIYIFNKKKINLIKYIYK